MAEEGGGGLYLMESGGTCSGSTASASTVEFGRQGNTTAGAVDVLAVELPLLLLFSSMTGNQGRQGGGIFLARYAP